MPHFLATNYLLAPPSSHPYRPGWIYSTQPAPDTKNLLRRAQFLSLAQLKKRFECNCVCGEQRQADSSAYTCVLAGFEIHVVKHTESLFTAAFNVTIRAI